MATIRTRPILCECPTFPCPCIAQIYNRSVGKWYCGYCTSRNYTPLNRCCRCDLPGRCVEKRTGNWWCEEHGHQCDVLVPRPPGCGWPARNLPCSQLAYVSDHEGRFICEDHLNEMAVVPENIRLRGEQPQVDVANLAQVDADGEMVDLESFSTIVEKECPICLEPKYKFRQLTVCGHELCEDCLREQLRSSLYNKFLCPFDRRPML